MIPELINSYTRTLDYLHRLVDDLPDEMFARQVGGAVNHPAWVIGHLVHSAQAIGGEMGLDPWLPLEWTGLFATGTSPTQNRHDYPAKPILLNALDDGQQRIVTRLNELGDDGLSMPLPDEKDRSIFRTVGHAVLHILTVHAAIHVGQLTVWRRAAGFGPLTQSFV